jgi:hypothetical protein
MKNFGKEIWSNGRHYQYKPLFSQMSVVKEKIEHLEHEWAKNSDTPWQNWSKSRKWRKNQMNRYIRRQKIDEDAVGGKTGRKPTNGWEY